MKIPKSTELKKNLVRWQHNRLGMFIHWGLYAMPARHEWVQSKEKINHEDYRKYFEYFNPDLYDPEEWADYAAKAGMKYAVLTTKHHEGFCLWDSKLTDYKAPNTRCGKDLLKLYADAFRKAGIRVGLYYSLIDWHHPHFLCDFIHPMHENEAYMAENRNRDMKKYAEYLHGQVEEILTGYGEIDMIFFDFSYKHRGENIGKGREGWQSEELVKLCRKLQPRMLINDRLDLVDTDWGWDFITPEQININGVPKRNGIPVPWETCQTFSGSWGYFRDEYTWKSEEQLIKMLVDTVSKGGNLLLNVGPTARGEFDSRAKERLSGIGEWMRRHSESIYGCTTAPEEFITPRDCRYTWNPETNRLYLHLFSWPYAGKIKVEGLGNKIKYAQLLNDNSEVIIVNGTYDFEKNWEIETSEDTIHLKVPIQKPDSVPVIEIFLESVDLIS